MVLPGLSSPPRWTWRGCPARSCTWSTSWTPPRALHYPEATDPEGAEISNQALERDLERRAEQLVRQIPDTDSERVRPVGGTVAGSHLAMGDAPREIVHLAEDLTSASS
jgi:hypothetical protein